MENEDSIFGPPLHLRIPYDEGRFDNVGRLNDGRQFMGFVTGVFPDGYEMNHGNEDWRKVKRWIAVLHLFDQHGSHLLTKSRLGGFDIDGGAASEKADDALVAMLEGLRPERPRQCDIFVKPFAVIVDGITHGVFYKHVRYEDDGPMFEYVKLEPRDIMFHPPWDSGEYST